MKLLSTKRDGPVHEASAILVFGEVEMYTVLHLHAEMLFLCFESIPSRSQWNNLTIVLRLTFNNKISIDNASKS